MSPQLLASAGAHPDAGVPHSAEESADFYSTSGGGRMPSAALLGPGALLGGPNDGPSPSLGLYDGSLLPEKSQSLSPLVEPFSPPTNSLLSPLSPLSSFNPPAGQSFNTYLSPPHGPPVLTPNDYGPYLNVYPDPAGGLEDISTIFVVGFPDDMQEREFQNMFVFADGFEAATLKVPGSNANASMLSQRDRESSLSSSRSMNDGGSFAMGYSLSDGMGNANNSRKQIIGFAKFKTRIQALAAKDVLNGKKVDADRGNTLKAEMAKKNLHTKRGLSSENNNSILLRGGKPFNPLYGNTPPYYDDKGLSAYDAFYSVPFTESQRNRENSVASATGGTTSPFSTGTLSGFLTQSMNGLTLDDTTDGSENAYFQQQSTPTLSNSNANNSTSNSLSSTSSYLSVSPGGKGQPQPQSTGGTSPGGGGLDENDLLEKKSPLLTSNNQNFGALNPSDFAFANTAPTDYLPSDLASEYSSTPMHTDYSTSTDYGGSTNTLLGSNGPVTNGATAIIRNPSDMNSPKNTLYVGGLPSVLPSVNGAYNAQNLENALKTAFSSRPGFKQLSFRCKSNGPIVFVEFNNVQFATNAMNEMYGHTLGGLVKGGIRLSYSKNPLGVRSDSINNHVNKYYATNNY